MASSADSTLQIWCFLCPFSKESRKYCSQLISKNMWNRKHFRECCSYMESKWCTVFAKYCFFFSFLWLLGVICQQHFPKSMVFNTILFKLRRYCSQVTWKPCGNWRYFESAVHRSGQSRVRKNVFPKYEVPNNSKWCSKYYAGGTPKISNLAKRVSILRRAAKE